MTSAKQETLVLHHHSAPVLYTDYCTFFTLFKKTGEKPLSLIRFCHKMKNGKEVAVAGVYFRLTTIDDIK